MKALSLKEPWASKVLNGEKTIETRTWKTKHRGPLLLCASKQPKSSISGHAFAVCTLVDVVPMTEEHEKDACCGVYEGAYAWILKDITPIEPFPVRGYQGLFDVDMPITTRRREA